MATAALCVTQLTVPTFVLAPLALGIPRNTAHYLILYGFLKLQTSRAVRAPVVPNGTNLIDEYCWREAVGALKVLPEM